ncbi:MAG: 50S ribosomal protein L15 [Alphaproteobacteria bacterium]
MKLNEIRDNPGAHTKRTRLGRGLGSGKGQQAGRGQKGQKARTGVRIDGFEGGQMPLFRRLPKRGFVNIFKPDYAAVNVGKVQAFIDAGKLKASAAIDAAALMAAGVLSNARDGISLLGDGEIKAAIKITVTRASKSATEAVEKAGGTVTLLPQRPKPEGKLKPKSKRTA